MKKSKLYIIIIIVFVLAFFSCIKFRYLIFSKEVVATTIERKNLDKVLELKGTIKGKDDAEVYSFERRKILKIDVKEGDKVKASDILCEIKSSYDDAYIEKAELALEDAKYWYNIESALHEQGDISDREFRDAESNLKKAELNLKYIKEEDNIIESPIDGTVTRVNTDVGKIPLTTEPIFVIENIDELEMKLDISEKDIRYIKVGQSVKVKLETSDKQVYGTIKNISLSAEDKKGSTSEKVIPIYVKIDNKNKKIIAGTTGEAEIIINSVKNALVLSSKCLKIEKDKKYVYVIKNGIVKKIEVNVILDSNIYVAVKDSEYLKEGDKIVISPDTNLLDGQKVNIK